MRFGRWGVVGALVLMVGCSRSHGNDDHNQDDDVCIHEGVPHPLGDVWPADDGCNSCACTPDGKAGCTQHACTTTSAAPDAAVTDGSCLDRDGGIHALGAVFASADGCNTCACAPVGVQCTAFDCAKPEPFCTRNGQSYVAGTTIPGDDSCNTCTCRDNGSFVCTTATCSPAASCTFGGAKLRVGESVPCEDDCTRCICEDWPSGPMLSYQGIGGCLAPPAIERCENNELGMEKVRLLYIEKDVLAIEVAMPGCRMNDRHAFKVCHDGSFRLGSPVKASIYAVPFATPCAATVVGSRSVSLKPLIESYRETFPDASVELDLTVEGNDSVRVSF